eukprot:12049474-Karenia_brevis.AAC.1
MKHFRFAGHLARNKHSKLCFQLATARGQAFIENSRRNKHAKLAKCRQGGAQLPVYDHVLTKYFRDSGNGVWWEVAIDRNSWKKHENAFCAYARGFLNLD